jgi:hypothetical protein
VSLNRSAEPVRERHGTIANDDLADTSRGDPRVSPPVYSASRPPTRTATLPTASRPSSLAPNARTDCPSLHQQSVVSDWSELRWSVATKEHSRATIEGIQSMTEAVTPSAKTIP